MEIHKKSSIWGMTDYCRLKNGWCITKNVKIYTFFTLNFWFLIDDSLLCVYSHVTDTLTVEPSTGTGQLYIPYQHLQICWQLTNQQQWNNFISLTLYLWKKQSGKFRAHFDALESVGLSTVSNVNCQQCSDILHIEDF